MNTTSRMTVYSRALIVGLKAHGDQKRQWSNEPYMVHPVRVAEILRDTVDWLPYPSWIIPAALMHDVLEDTDYTSQQMRDEFGDAITDLVLEVTNIAQPTDGNRALRKGINIKHLRNASPNGKTIKAADIIDNATGIASLSPGFAKVYLQEKLDTLDVLKDTAHPELIAKAYKIIAVEQAKLAGVL